MVPQSTHRAPTSLASFLRLYFGADPSCRDSRGSPGPRHRETGFARLCRSRVRRRNGFTRSRRTEQKPPFSGGLAEETAPAVTAVCWKSGFVRSLVVRLEGKDWYWEHHQRRSYSFLGFGELAVLLWKALKGISSAVALDPRRCHLRPEFPKNPNHPVAWRFLLPGRTVFDYVKSEALKQKAWGKLISRQTKPHLEKRHLD